MAAAGSTLILHQYDGSPYSEKIRLALGLKGLAWRAVEIPMVMPKPDLMPLTGGYRKTPVLQIGADVYCDTQRILDEIEACRPEPTLHPLGDPGLARVVGAWCDRVFFATTVGLIFGTVGDNVPEAFIRDREKLSGRSWDIAAMKQALPSVKEQWRAQLDWLERQLADGRSYLLGESASLSDVHAYMNVWFARQVGGRFGMPGDGEPYPGAAILEAFPNVMAWADRLAAIGHGAPEPMDAKEALAVARDAQPAAAQQADPGEPNGWRPGDRVAVAPDDYGRDPVAGELVASSAREIALRRHDEQVGEIVVHFPRAGFTVSAG